MVPRTGFARFGVEGTSMVRTRLLVGPLLLAGFMVVLSVGGVAQERSGADWRQWGGPDRNFIVDARGLAESWREDGPPVLWSRPLGTGHSSILASDGKLFTLYRVGNGRGRQGPWEAEEAVIALDASTGETIWEYTYPSRLEDTSFGSGPHSTPLLVGDRLFATGTNKQLHAFAADTGELLWSHDLVADFGAPPLLVRPRIKAGYGCSPVAYRDTIICSVGGPGQSVMAFRQSDGAVVWRSGDFLISEAPPLVIDLDGQDQLVILAGGTLNGLDPVTGRLLWTHPHDPGNDFNFMVPLWGDDHIIFVSSGYKTGSRALQLTRVGDTTRVEELWYDPQLQFMFLNPIRVGNYVYGTDGTFGPAFMTGVDIRTGETVWQERGFARSTLLHADGKTIIVDEDGDLALARLTPDGMTLLARAPLFETVAWSAPTLVGTTLYVRDREKIVALDLGAE
ncbi:MAG: hypothetical protein CL477_19365 [Acidobacteria bacterium]|nr:hypothetical protein [Acidobacteriota bacterium]HJN45933.1 PQQ-binding-like beta-propeller repeat protein [Vicinamibacterales bacterium]